MVRYRSIFEILTIVEATFVFGCAQNRLFRHEKKLCPKSISLCKKSAHVSLVFVLVLNTRQTLRSGFKIQALKHRLHRKKTARFVTQIFSRLNVFLYQQPHDLHNKCIILNA